MLLKEVRSAGLIVAYVGLFFSFLMLIPWITSVLTGWDGGKSSLVPLSTTSLALEAALPMLNDGRGGARLRSMDWSRTHGLLLGTQASELLLVREAEVAAVARNFEASDSVSLTADAVALDVAAAAAPPPPPPDGAPGSPGVQSPQFPGWVYP